MTRLRLTALERCLYAFETACPDPTVEATEAWCAQFPQFADQIREHADYADPPSLHGKDAVALLSEAEKEEGRAQGLKILESSMKRQLSFLQARAKVAAEAAKKKLPLKNM